ncbi:hypothetical protein FVEN_g10371 [Fusarium venenatum]|uniref:Zn(2)-C6 fungal-type domain-containing protein n=1 Tax=Fusarium venenatum TaxID=56646 RepID=A0A2L2T3D9_9HYPO|nr:uncharacterized protein FVRRES_06559 [Fusarium venenatum]KAG8351560.1 hypothetical protein FVEN_g10371 [Fusarium venenatum]KAH6993549.1 hypothetical protein EDB82DRAFT_173449 [Fusarium venenatum]CEI62123.1 unnamed protein product [Fusarium venenatum]
MEPQGSRKLVPILPAQQIPDLNRQDGGANSESSSTGQGQVQSEAQAQGGQGQRTRAKRNLVAVACEGCRRKKAKCDGRRPTCGRCSSKMESCLYESPPVPFAVKKKCDTLMLENQQYRELFNAIHERPDCEAQEIFNRIRISNEPLSVLEAIKQAEVLLPDPVSSHSDGTPQGSVPSLYHASSSRTQDSDRS